MRGFLVILVLGVVGFGCTDDEYLTAEDRQKVEERFKELHEELLVELEGEEANFDTSSMAKAPNFISKLKAKGFGTDTARLRVLARYAYFDLRKTPFTIVDGDYHSPLNIKNSKVLSWRDGKERDTLFTNCLSNGKGYYFVKVDSLGNGLKNSFDFGFEIWDHCNKDLALINSIWKSYYHPMPLFTQAKENKLYVFYTRESNNYRLLEEVMGDVLEE